MSPDPQITPEVACQRTNVCPRGAFDHHIHIHNRNVTTVVVRGRHRGLPDDFETVDHDGTRLKLDVLASPCEGVGTFPVNLDGTDRGRHLKDLSAIRLQRPVDSLTRKWRASRLLNDLALGIIRVGGNAQTNRRQIGFRRTRNILQKFRPAVNTEDEDARRHWIQCSRVTNAARLRQPPPPSNHVVRRQASWLINEEDPGLNETRFDRPCSRSLGCPLFQSWPSRPLRLILRRQHTAKHHRRRTGPEQQRQSLRHSLEPHGAPPR